MHGDIKGDNVLVFDMNSDNPRYALTDFGAALKVFEVNTIMDKSQLAELADKTISELHDTVTVRST